MGREEPLPWANRAIFPLDAVALDRTSTTPLHRQLYKLLQSYIVTGRLAAGSRLPADARPCRIWRRSGATP